MKNLGPLVLTKLPPVSTLVAQHEGGHGFISAACLDLSVSAVLSLALAADKHISLCAAHFGKLVLSNGLLGQRFPDLFQLCACHLFCSHAGDPFRCDVATQNVPA